MAKRQNFVVGSANTNIETQTVAQLNHAWDSTVVLKSKVLNGVFNAVSDYSNDSSNEIANAIQALTGEQPTGASQSELASALQKMREDIETSSLTFKGYVSTSAPSSSTYGLVAGNIWINANAMPTTFPVAIAGVWNGTQWASTTDTYSPNDFDFFRNINDNEGYYWFGGRWVVMSTDMSTTYFVLNQATGKWEIKQDVALPGSPTIQTTPSINDNSDKIPTTAWVRNLITPTGVITTFGGLTAPAGWLLCDGSSISQSTYTDLFAVIGGEYSTGIYAWETTDISGNKYYTNKATDLSVGDIIYTDTGVKHDTVASATASTITGASGDVFSRAIASDKTTFNLPDEKTLTPFTVPDYTHAYTDFNFNTEYTASEDMFLWLYSSQTEAQAGAAPTIRIQVDGVNVAKVGEFGYNQDSTHVIVPKGSKFKGVIDTGGWNVSRHLRGWPLIKSPQLNTRHIIKY